MARRFITKTMKKKHHRLYASTKSSSSSERGMMRQPKPKPKQKQIAAAIAIEQKIQQIHEQNPLLSMRESWRQDPNDDEVEDRKSLPSPPATCALCEGPAAVYCSSDEACLCWDCDSIIHSANFLVARHARSFLCCVCGGSATAEAPSKPPEISTITVTGPHLTPRRIVCSACLSNPSLLHIPALLFSPSSSSSSSSFSSSSSSSSSSSYLGHSHGLEWSGCQPLLHLLSTSSEGAGDSQEDNFSDGLTLGP